VVQIILAVILILGSACLMAAAFKKYTEGKTLLGNRETELKYLRKYKIKFYPKLVASVIQLDI